MVRSSRTRLKVGLLEARTNHDVRDQLEDGIEMPRERRDRERGRIRSDVHIELGTEAAERLGHLDGVARSGALVEQVGRQARETVVLRRIVARPSLDDERERDDRNRVLAESPERRARWRACRATTSGKRTGVDASGAGI